MFFKLSIYGFVSISLQWSHASIDVSQEIFTMDILKALKSYLKHHRKHVLRLLQIYGDQALVWGENKRIHFQVFSIQKITDMLSSNHNLSLYAKFITVLNKEDWQIKT